jgi:serine/threonine protein kinase
MNPHIVNLRPLQSGGYGDLYLGERTDTGEQVVIKYLRNAHLPHVRKGFAREVRILARQLPGIVRVVAWDLKANPPYYVMPCLGGSLKAHAGKLSTDQLRAVARELANALAILHDQQIYHGDIKPDNILVAWDGRLQVADPLGNGFGCTMLFSENRGGTPGYWPPEIRNGGQIHAAGDAYSLGATLYELSTGQKPHDDQNLDPGPWSDAKIREIVVACCTSDPGSRPTMKDTLRLLEGERWIDIQTARRQRQELLGACVLGGLGLALVFALAQGRAKA